MKTYTDMIHEFFSNDGIDHKKEFLRRLETEELKTIRSGFREATSLYDPGSSNLGRWIKFIDELICERKQEERNDKIKSLGI